MIDRLPGPTAVKGREGTRIGRYWLHDCLGHGSHTAVYSASTPSGEWCALKLVDRRLQGGENLVDRVLHEAEMIERIGNPYILPILNAVASDDMTAVVMPFVDGLTLRDLMRSGRLDTDDAWTYMTQVAESLRSAHLWGLSYRVLKPANILVRDGRAYLAEFGVTGRSTGKVGLTAPDCQLSGAQYLAPEQIHGAEPDHRTDIYALAVLAFELATSTPLYEADRSSAILEAALNHTPPSAHARDPRVPPDVDGVLRRALSRDPRRRHDSVDELIGELVSPPVPNGGGPTGAERVQTAEPAPGPVTVDSLIDVLSGLLIPDDAEIDA